MRRASPSSTPWPSGTGSGSREPLAGTLEERAQDLAGRGAWPELDDAMLEGLRWLDKGVHAICHPGAEETSDMTWPCSAKAFCQVLKILKDLHVVVRNAFDWPIGSGLYVDRLRACDLRAQEDSPSPS